MKPIPMARWPGHYRTGVRIQSTKRNHRQKGGGILYTNMIWMFGKNVAPGLSLPRAAGKDDVVHVCYGYGLFTGGPGLNGGSHTVGSLHCPCLPAIRKDRSSFFGDLEATIICCTPSYAAYIAETIAEKGLKDKIKAQGRYIRGQRHGARKCAMT